MSNIFFTSDLHFDHKNIINHSNRPFNNVEEMNEGLKNNYNEVVGPKDLVYFLGDLCFSKNQRDAVAHIAGLKGRKILIHGNHDNSRYKKAYTDASLFEACYDYFELRMNRELYVLCHFPFASWNGAYHGSYNFHGHCHGFMDQENKGRRRLDVGVDSNNYRPISLENAVEKIHRYIGGVGQLDANHH